MVEYHSGTFYNPHYSIRINIYHNAGGCFAEVYAQKLKKRSRFLRYFGFAVAPISEKSIDTCFRIECNRVANIFSVVSVLPVHTDTSVLIFTHPSVLVLTKEDLEGAESWKIIGPRFNSAKRNYTTVIQLVENIFTLVRLDPNKIIK